MIEWLTLNDVGKSLLGILGLGSRMISACGCADRQGPNTHPMINMTHLHTRNLSVHGPSFRSPYSRYYGYESEYARSAV